MNLHENSLLISMWEVLKVLGIPLLFIVIVVYILNFLKTKRQNRIHSFEEEKRKKLLQQLIHQEKLNELIKKGL